MWLHGCCRTMLYLARFDVDNDMTASTPEWATATTMRELQCGEVDSFVHIHGIVIVVASSIICAKASIIEMYNMFCHNCQRQSMPERMNTSYKVQQRASWYTLQYFIHTQAQDDSTLCFTKQPLSTVSRIYYIKIVANVYCGMHKLDVFCNLISVFCVIRWREEVHYAF